MILLKYSPYVEQIRVLEFYKLLCCPISFSTFSRVHFLISPLFFCRQYETVVPLEDSVVTEVTATLQEWAVLWKQLYVVRAVLLFLHISNTLGEMLPCSDTQKYQNRCQNCWVPCILWGFPNCRITDHVKVT